MKTAGFILGLSLLTTLPCEAVVTVRLNNIDCGYPVNFYEDPFLKYGPAMVEICYSVAGSSSAIYTFGTQNAYFTVDQNGFFDGGIGVIPDVDPGWGISFTLYAWEQGQNFDNANLRTAVVWSQTGFISWDPESGLPPTGTILNIPPNITAPEPSTLALGGMGALLFFFSRNGGRILRRRTATPCRSMETPCQPKNHSRLK